MQKLHPEKKDKLLATGGTFIFSALLLVLCLALGLKIPFPLPTEEGVEIRLGDSEFGLGSPDGGFYSNLSSDDSPMEHIIDEGLTEIATQSTEESVNLPTEKKENDKKPKETKPDQKPTQTNTQQTNTQQALNPNAVYGGKTTGTSGGGYGTGDGTGQGNTSGDGFMGHPEGDPNSTRFDGAPGSGGNGINASLTGRSSINLEKPKYNSKREGTVVVKILVDRQGNVLTAEAGERGTTVVDNNLYEAAKQAALKSKFTSNPNAEALQVGTITYKFVLK